MVFVRFSSSLFICQLLFSNDLLCSSWKGKARKCASSHHRRRHPWGVSSRERPRRLMHARLSMRTSSLKEGQPSNCQEVRQSLFFIAIELFDATTIEEVMATWLLSEEVFESNRHFDDRQSWESVQEFTQVCTTEWRAFRRSVQEWIICGVQNQVKSWTALSTCRGSDYISTKDELQLLCWWTVQWTLVWTFPPLC